MIFMLSTSIIAMVFNLGSFSNDWSFDEGTLWPLLTVGASLLLLASLLLALLSLLAPLLLATRLPNVPATDAQEP